MPLHLHKLSVESEKPILSSRHYSNNLKANLVNHKVNPEIPNDTPEVKRSLSVKMNFWEENETPNIEVDNKIDEEFEEGEIEPKSTVTKLQPNILQSEELTHHKLLNFLMK